MVELLVGNWWVEVEGNALISGGVTWDSRAAHMLTTRVGHQIRRLAQGSLAPSRQFLIELLGKAADD